MNEARAIVNRREYKDMVKDVSLEADLRDWGAKDWKKVSSLSISVFNVLFSMAAVFVSIMYVGGTVNMALPMRVLLSLTGAFVVGFAEGWFFTKDWLKVDK